MTKTDSQSALAEMSDDEIQLARHLSDRIGFGPRPGDIDAITRMGADVWIDTQLRPASLPLPEDLSQRLGELNTLRLSPADAFAEYGPQALRAAGKSTEARQALQQKARQIPAEAMEARVMRAVYSPRQLEESLVDFWFNHFNVFVGKNLDRVWVSAYEQDAIRPHVLGRFRDLLGATAKHPAMLFYLDNWQNTAPGSAGARGQFTGLNENYARELMELHTLGVDGGYTQADVIALARILTGWGLGGERGGPPRVPGQGKRFGVQGRVQEQAMTPDTTRRGGFAFAENRHDFSDKIFLGQKIQGVGEREGEQALDMLAHHPATARHIAYKLSQYFLADAPPPAVVAAVSETFSKSGGDITATLRTLFSRPEFRDPATFGTRFKTPLRYVVSAVRASGVEVRNFRPLFGVLTQLGQPLYGCLTPDGYKCTEGAWMNADGVTRRVTFAVALASGHLPLRDAPDRNAGVNARKPEQLAGRVANQMANATDKDAPPTDPPVDVKTLLAALGGQVSDNTRAVMAKAQPELRAALLLGSPDFMRS